MGWRLVDVYFVNERLLLVIALPYLCAGVVRVTVQVCEHRRERVYVCIDVGMMTRRFFMAPVLNTQVYFKRIS